jgi:hypothetical protein
MAINGYLLFRHWEKNLMFNICINMIVMEGSQVSFFLFLSDNSFPQVHILICLGQPVLEPSPFFFILVWAVLLSLSTILFLFFLFDFF